MSQIAPSRIEAVKLGIDTGGTYTDAVLLDPDGQVVATAKSETTRDDLSRGIGRAVKAVVEAHPCKIDLIGLSTTLATNAIVEGRGGKAGLVMIGFGPDALRRGGLDRAMRGDPVIAIEGGHDAHGQMRLPLDLNALDHALQALPAGSEAMAVTSAFAVRNPEHELAAAARIRAQTGLPVTVSHVLTGKLDGPKRALTTLFNARLIPEIGRLLAAVERLTAELGINAPIMVVRGDGSLMRARIVKHRPVETILSGPAASVVGAAKLAGVCHALIADVGGTTTDIALLDRGRPKLDPAGARVGDHRTMVEAIDLRTTGLGGDSRWHHRGTHDQCLGPERSIPLSLLAHDHPEILADLEAQLNREIARPLDAQFAKLIRRPNETLSRRQAELIALLQSGPRTLEQIVERAHLELPLNRFMARGLVAHAGFTPSDAAHLLDLQSNWHRAAAEMGARLEARKLRIQEPKDFAQSIMRHAKRATALALLEVACGADGEAAAHLLANPTVQRAADPVPPENRHLQLEFRLDRPVIAVGGPASLFYPDAVGRLNTELQLPPHHRVANAVGAVSGEVARTLTLSVTQIAEERYVWQLGDHREEGTDARALADAADIVLEREAVRLFEDAGGVDPHIERQREVKQADLMAGREMIVEIALRCTVRGRPAIT